MQWLSQPCASLARGCQQVPRRLRSTVVVAQGADGESAAPRPADWDSAKPYSEIPGPRSLPIIGNFWRFLPVIGNIPTKSTVDTLNFFRKEYGSISRLAGIPLKPDVVFITDGDYLEQVFRNEGQWPFRRGADSLTYYFRHLRKGYPVSLVASQGKEWQEFRTAVNQVMMQPRNTKQYVEPIDRVSQEFIDRMRAIRDDNLRMPTNFENEISKWALESITYVALDTRLGVLQDLHPDSEGSKMIESVHLVFDSMYKLDFLPSLWKVMSTPTYRKFVASMDHVTEVSTKYVNMAMERLKSLPPSEAESRTYSVLENLLLRTGDPQRAVTMALDMLLAGIDTTGNVVATVLYQLATHPEKQRKLQEELDRVIPDPTQTITKTQLEELRYLRACVKETMRVMPIFVGNTRDTVKDMVIGGYQVPAGTMLSLSGKFMCDSDEFFARAKEFLPERWLPGADDLKAKHPFAHLPFGFGPRSCVGKRFADLEIETLVAKIFRNFTMEWDGPPPKYTLTILLRFTDPLTFTVKDRV